MKNYSIEEKRKMIHRINKIQRIEFRFKNENGRTPNNAELADILNESLDRIIEVREFLKEFEKEDEHFKSDSIHYTKQDIEKAREIRKNKKEIQHIKKYMSNNLKSKVVRRVYGRE